MTPPEFIAHVARERDYISAEIREGRYTADLLNRTTALAFDVENLPAEMEKDRERFNIRSILGMLKVIEQRLAVASGAGKFKAIPITHDRQRCCDSDFYR